MKIEFYIPEDQKIPTRLRLKADDRIDIYYDRVFLGEEGAFAYDLTFYGANKTECKTIAKEVADILVDQSEDHGSRWVLFNIEEVFEPVIGDNGRLLRLFFRTRDSY